MLLVIAQFIWFLFFQILEILCSHYPHEILYLKENLEITN